MRKIFFWQFCDAFWVGELLSFVHQERDLLLTFLLQVLQKLEIDVLWTVTVCSRNWTDCRKGSEVAVAGDLHSLNCSVPFSNAVKMQSVAAISKTKSTRFSQIRFSSFEDNRRLWKWISDSSDATSTKSASNRDWIL